VLVQEEEGTSLYFLKGMYRTCSPLKRESKTTNNLKNAFGGKSKANRYNLVLVEKVERDDLPQTAKLLRAVLVTEITRFVFVLSS